VPEFRFDDRSSEQNARTRARAGRSADQSQFWLISLQWVALGSAILCADPLQQPRKRGGTQSALALFDRYSEGRE